MALLDATTPRLSAIAPGLPFADVLAGHVLADFGGDPLALADVTILVPNRRAVRAVRDAFLRRGDGKLTILPRLAALGDVDEDELIITLPDGAAEALEVPPAIGKADRLLHLARLIMAWRTVQPGSDPVPPGQALALARDLAGLLDSVESEQLSFDGLHNLVDAQHAQHWETTLQFLDILTTHWPAILDELGAIDPIDRRNRLMAAQAGAWENHPPRGVVIAAGSTGTMPATANLLRVIARLPRGLVVLPGFVPDVPDDLWEAIGDCPTHPWFTLHRLLTTMETTRHDVVPLSPATSHPVPSNEERAALVQEALWPAALTHRWRAFAGERRKAALDGLTRLDCANPREEAATIAMALRAAAEHPTKTAALVTPDRRLARRVSAELARWGITVDDSAGLPIAQSQRGVFLRLILDAVESGLAPVPFLALLKHPLCSAGRTASDVSVLARALDEQVLRGPRPAPGLEGLQRAMDQAVSDRRCAFYPGQKEKVTAIITLLAPLLDQMNADDHSAQGLFDAHLSVAEALATSRDTPGAHILWTGEEGEALAGVLIEARQALASLGTIDPGTYRGLFAELITGEVVRPRYGAHPRLLIWGPIEARLQGADLIILGGLNEESWPQAPAHDPWMNTKMKTDFGLPHPDRRVGQAAHDFLMASCAPEVILTRSEKADGAPTVPSRWLNRLEALAALTPVRDHPFQHWVQLIDRPSATQISAPPAPRPPLEARPDRLSVTRVQKLMQDPYSLYAEKILNLVPLDPLDAEPGALERGNFIHDALDKFIAATLDGWPDDAEDLLMRFGREAFAPFAGRPAVEGFWWPRFVQVAQWFLREEPKRRQHYQPLATEVKAGLRIHGCAMPFTLEAKADRIDLELDSAALEIIDYKTGSIPTAKQWRAGFAPQMPLEGLLARQGAFENIDAGVVAGLTFWKVTGGREPVTTKSIEDHDARIDEAEAGLKRLVNDFANPDTPYLSNPRPAFTGYGEHDHLARVREWRTVGLGKDSGDGS